MIYLSKEDLLKLEFVAKNTRKFSEHLSLFDSIVICDDNENYIEKSVLIDDERQVAVIKTFVETGKALNDIYFMASYPSFLPEDEKEKVKADIQYQVIRLQSAAALMKLFKRRNANTDLINSSLLQLERMRKNYA